MKPKSLTFTAWPSLTTSLGLLTRCCASSETWTRPWSFSLNLTKDASQEVFEYAYHEGNYAIKNILSAARSEEKR